MFPPPSTRRWTRSFHRVRFPGLRRECLSVLYPTTSTSVSSRRLRDCGGCRKGETGRKCLQENSRHYKLHGRGRQRPHEGNGAGELPAHQGRGEADCAGGTGAYQKRSGAV